MELVRDWRRQAARAAGATALAPAVLLIAAVLLAAGGGLGGLGSVGQIATGPSVPPAELAADRAGVSGSSSAQVAAATRATPRSAPSPRRTDARDRVAAPPAQRAEPVNRGTIRLTPREGAPRQEVPSVRPKRPTVGNRPSTPPSRVSPSPLVEAPAMEITPLQPPSPVQQIAEGFSLPLPAPLGLPEGQGNATPPGVQVNPSLPGPALR